MRQDLHKMRLGILLCQARKPIRSNGYVRRTLEPTCRGSRWPKIGQSEHQKGDCNGLRHIRYIKICEFIKEKSLVTIGVC